MQLKKRRRSPVAGRGKKVLNKAVPATRDSRHSAAYPRPATRDPRPSSDGALVIVESPAKCRTIEKILGKRFQVVASMGHIIDLPRSKMGIDLEHGFVPQYIVLKEKKKVLAHLKDACRGKSELYLACDPDREGEAIAWHLMNELSGKKNGVAVYRVRFNEITKTALEEAFKNRGSIDMNLVGAQQARRILDRIVGYSLSPLLWQKVAKGLSAGRVQSVALRLIVDREKAIKAFVPLEYWTIDADLAKREGDRTAFAASLEKKNSVDIEIKNGEDARRVSAETRGLPFRTSEVRETVKKRAPQAPFTTSKLQQEAYNRLRFAPSRTMRIAQTLYEGTDLGEGETTGLITYMRTDSVNVSAGALAEVRKFISQEYGADYLPEKPNAYKSKKSAQEAHEAIRPTAVHRRPDSLRSFLNDEQFQLYSLIWAKFIASQMMPALMRQTSADIAAGVYLFKATGLQVEFPGFLKVLEEKDEKEDGERKFLPPLAEGEELDLKKLGEAQHFTKPPPRFTDASLVKILEEEGIGRPSTYAPIIETLVDRNYIERQGGALVPTELGFIVVALLVKHFSRLMDVNFTAEMESDLDRVEEGTRKWADLLKEFYKDFAAHLVTAQESMKGVKKMEIPTNETCEMCKRPLVVKWGRRGKFLSCSGFPECRFSKSIPTHIACPQCMKGMLVARKAKSGRGRKFYGCTEYPNCTFITQRLPLPAGQAGAPAAAQVPQEPGAPASAKADPSSGGKGGSLPAGQAGVSGGNGTPV